MRKIRRARPEDARGIHDAHMRSIKEVCSRDYAKQLVDAWGDRPFREEERLNTIKNHMVWVIDNDGTIEGYGQLALIKGESEMSAHIYGLYLTPEALDQGLGRQMAEVMILTARNTKATIVTLEASATAREFYRKLGFEDTGAEITLQIGGAEIPCFPMWKKLG